MGITLYYIIQDRQQFIFGSKGFYGSKVVDLVHMRCSAFRSSLWTEAKVLFPHLSLRFIADDKVMPVINVK